MRTPPHASPHAPLHLPHRSVPRRRLPTVMAVALADHPDRDAELARLGEALLEALPAHCAQGELIGPQALWMVHAIAADQSDDPARQAAVAALHEARLEQAMLAQDGAAGTAAGHPADPQ